MGFSHAVLEIASSLVSKTFPDLTPPSRLTRIRSRSRRSESIDVQRNPNDLCSRSSRSNPLLPQSDRTEHLSSQTS